MVPGIYTDGRSSRTHPVELSAEGPLLVVTDPAGARLTWPRARITISTRLGHTPRVLRLPDGGQVECADATVLGEWFPQAGGLEAAADWLERRLGAMVIAAVATVAVLLAGLRFGVPWAAAEIAQRMPSRVEAAIGGHAESLIGQMYLADSRLAGAVQARLRDKFDELVAGEPRSGGINLKFADSRVLGANAFALPGGTIFVTDALVELAGSDDEVLAVLAHEAGHHLHRHGVRQTIEHSSVFMLAGLLLGDASGSSIAVAIPAALINSGFSREHEREADAYAFDLLLRKGRSPSDFAAILRRLARAQAEPLGGEVAGYLSTHPPSPERIAAAEAAARP